MNNIFVCSARSRFSLKLIHCIAFRPANRASCLLKSIAINFQLQFFERYHIFSDHFSLADEESFFHPS